MLNYGTGRMIGGPNMQGPAADPRMHALQNSMMQQGAPVLGGGMHRYADTGGLVQPMGGAGVLGPGVPPGPASALGAMQGALAQPQPIGIIPFNPHIGDPTPVQPGGFSSMLSAMRPPALGQMPSQMMSAVPAGPQPAAPALYHPAGLGRMGSRF